MTSLPTLPILAKSEVMFFPKFKYLFLKTMSQISHKLLSLVVVAQVEKKVISHPQKVIIEVHSLGDGRGEDVQANGSFLA